MVRALLEILLFLEGTAMLKVDIMGEEFETGSDNSSPMAGSVKEMLVQ